MAEIDNTTSAIMWQWLAEHKQVVLDYFASIMREASDIQLVNFDVDRHMGLLATYVFQGIHRVDNVKPSSLVEGLTRLNDELRIRCENAAAEAERQGAYAEQQGDRVDDRILDLTNLKQTVTQQGNTAEQQGINAQNICDEVTAWYPPFKADAEDWLYYQKADWADWYPSTQSTWNDWYAARVQQWLSWYTDGVVPTWDNFWAGVQNDWSDWTAKETARQRAELDRIAAELTRKADEEVRQQKELERQQAEEVRLDGTFRQNTDTGQWERLNQRTSVWEDTGNSWMGGLFAFKFYTNPKTGRCHVVKNSIDKVSFSIRNGRLIGTYNG